MLQMIGRVLAIISYFLPYSELVVVDVIMSGKSSGVAVAEKGDVMVLTIDGLGALEVKVT